MFERETWVFRSNVKMPKEPFKLQRNMPFTVKLFICVLYPALISLINPPEH